ncbi:MAG: LuxR C-terminal-related transcriptional regulator [Longimicrobiales bacterium]
MHGRTSRQISQILVITEATARHHVERVMLKLGVSSRHEVHSKARRAGTR